MYLAKHHYEADRELAEEAFTIVFDREPTISERQLVQAVGTAESSGGRGWKGEGANSNNIGAIQAGRPPCNPETSFQTTDTHEDGSKYVWCYKKYPTRLDGWVDLVRTLYTGRFKSIDRDVIRQLADEGDFMGAVAAQRASGYFEAPLSRYQTKVHNILTEMSAALEEPYNPKGVPGRGY